MSIVLFVMNFARLFFDVANPTEISIINNTKETFFRLSFIFDMLICFDINNRGTNLNNKFENHYFNGLSPFIDKSGNIIKIPIIFNKIINNSTIKTECEKGNNFFRLNINTKENIKIDSIHLHFLIIFR